MQLLPQVSNYLFCCWYDPYFFILSLSSRLYISFSLPLLFSDSMQSPFIIEPKLSSHVVIIDCYLSTIILYYNIVLHFLCIHFIFLYPVVCSFEESNIFQSAFFQFIFTNSKHNSFVKMFKYKFSVSFSQIFLGLSFYTNN